MDGKEVQMFNGSTGTFSTTWIPYQYLVGNAKAYCPGEMTVFTTFSVEEFDEVIQKGRCGEHKGTSRGRVVRVESADGPVYCHIRKRRLRVFREKGLECVYCGRRGTHWRAERGIKDKLGKIQLNLYSGKIKMTVDHIMPRVYGGKNAVENLQPMCEPCNTHKSDRWIG